MINKFHRTKKEIPYTLFDLHILDEEYGGENPPFPGHYEALKNRYNSDKESTHLEARVGDIKESVCDNSKIVNVLGLKEFTPFAEGIYKV